MYGTTDGAHSVEFTGESGQVEVGSWFHGDVAADGSITLDLSTFTNCEDYTAKVLNSDGYMMTFTGTMENCPTFETYYMPALQQLAINAQSFTGGIEGSDHVRLGFVRNTGTTYFSGDFTYDSELGFVGTIAAGFNTMLEMGTITVDVYDSNGAVTDIFTFEGREALQSMGQNESIYIEPVNNEQVYMSLSVYFGMILDIVGWGVSQNAFFTFEFLNAQDSIVHTRTHMRFDSADFRYGYSSGYFSSEITQVNIYLNDQLIVNYQDDVVSNNFKVTEYTTPQGYGGINEDLDTKSNLDLSAYGDELHVRVTHAEGMTYSVITTTGEIALYYPEGTGVSLQIWDTMMMNILGSKEAVTTTYVEGTLFRILSDRELNFSVELDYLGLVNATVPFQNIESVGGPATLYIEMYNEEGSLVFSEGDVYNGTDYEADYSLQGIKVSKLEGSNYTFSKSWGKSFVIKMYADSDRDVVISEFTVTP